MSNPMQEEFQKLYEVVKQLRDPKDGCPWDLKQTHESLLPYMAEEAYEFIHAAEDANFPHMKDELGDVFLQILLHTEMADEKGNFTLSDVMKNLREKLIRRHPHVFDEKVKNMTPEEVSKRWKEIKKEEKKDQTQTHIDESVLHAPALMSADEIGKKTAEVGFDWENAAQVSYKVEEEWQELKEELGPLGKGCGAKIEEELGDFLFSAAQLARHLGFQPEQTLRAANQKFLRRFQEMEILIKEDGQTLEDLNQEQMDVFWNVVKQNERKNV